MADLKAEFEKLKNLKLTKEQQQSVALVILLAAGLVYGYWNFVLKPLNASIAELTEKAKTKREMIDKARKLKAQWEEYNQRMARVQTAESYVNRRLPPATEFTVAMARMIRLSLEGSVDWLSYRGEEKGSGGNKSEFPGFDKKSANFTLIGGFHRLGAFLSRLTAEDPVFNIEDVKLAGGVPGMLDATGWSAAIDIKLVTYSETVAVKK